VTTLGTLNGALELAEQVRRGECPAPDAVFVPLGTCGTTAGLALGFALAGLDVALHAVRITGPSWANLRNVQALAQQTAHLLGERARLCRLEVEGGFLGEGYGAPTPEGTEAQAFFAPLPLDTSYASKAAACLLASRSRYRTPLFWLTSA
jgi:D-cysteine desulfhydrase